MLDSYPYDVRQRRAERNGQDRSLKRVASVPDWTHWGKDNKFAAFGGDQTGFGGIMCDYARLEQPLTIGEFHAAG